MLTVQHYRRQGTHPGAAATAARHVNLQVAGGHRRVATRMAVCAYANTRTRTSSLRRATCDAACGTRESPDQPRGRPRFGTGIGHFSNRKSGVSRYPLRTRVRTYVISDGLVCMWHETKLERQVRQSSALPAARSGHFFDYYCRSAFFLHLASAGFSLARASTAFFTFTSARMHARTSAPVLTARAAVSR